MVIDISKEINSFQETLRNVGSALEKSFSGQASWGVAGFREETLIFFLAETMRKLDWKIEYEYPYYHYHKHWRCDIKAEKKSHEIWIEAKWWWSKINEIGPIITSDLHKFKCMKSNVFPIALIFTVDDRKTIEDSLQWTIDGAKIWMEEIITNEDLCSEWQHLGTATVKSPYSIINKNNNKLDRKNGVFAASFYLYKAFNCPKSKNK